MPLKLGVATAFSHFGAEARSASGPNAVLPPDRSEFAEFKRLDDVGDWKWFLLIRLLREPSRVPRSVNGQALLYLTAISVTRDCFK
jgi:hypothetical protein